MNPLHLSLFGAGVTALTLGIYDKKTGLMPNVLTVGSLLMAFVTRLIVEGKQGALSALLGLLLVAAPPAILFFRTRGDAIGGGDVKALAALGAWLGPRLGLEVELLSFGLLAGFAVFAQAKKGKLFPLLARSLSLLLPRRLRQTAEPLSSDMTYVRFGPFLAIGTMIGCVSSAFPTSLSLWTLVL